MKSDTRYLKLLYLAILAVPGRAVFFADIFQNYSHTACLDELLARHTASHFYCRKKSCNHLFTEGLVQSKKPVVLLNPLEWPFPFSPSARGLDDFRQAKPPLTPSLGRFPFEVLITISPSVSLNKGCRC